MPEVSRRAVLGGGAAIVGGLAVGLGPTLLDPTAADAAGAAHKRKRKLKPGLTRAHYEPAVGKVFTLERNGRIHKARLTRISKLANTTAKQHESCFNLIFTPHRRIPEGIYTVRRRGVHTHRLFLGPLGTGTTMQALVNRSR